jgi:hypothetical protein
MVVPDATAAWHAPPDGDALSPFTVVAALKLYGVPVGETSAARAILHGKIAKATDAVRVFRGLRSPFAQCVALRSSGLYSRVTWLLAACAPGVVDDTTVQLVEDAETDELHHLLGRHWDMALPEQVLQMCIPWQAGGLGVRDVASCGAVGVDGRWKLFTADEADAKVAERKQLITETWRDAATDPQRRQRLGLRWSAGSVLAQVRRWDEQTACAGKAMRWLGLNMAEQIDAARPAAEESALLAHVLGVWLLDEAQLGAHCRAGHNHRQGDRVGRIPLMAPDGSNHLSICTKEVTNQRHHAAQDRLCVELRRANPGAVVLKEQSIGPNGKPVPRARNSGAYVPGDVTVQHDNGRPVYIDLVFKGADSKSVAARGDTSCGLAEKEKAVQQARAKAQAGPHLQLDMVPFAVSSWGDMGGAAVSKVGPMLAPLVNGKKDWVASYKALDRVVWAGMLAQIQGSLRVLSMLPP